MKLKLFLALFLFVGYALASPFPNCNATFEGSLMTCTNGYGSVSQDPFLIQGVFHAEPSLNVTSFQDGIYTFAVGVTKDLRPLELDVWANVSKSVPTLGWVLHSVFLQNVQSFVNFSGNPAPCDVGETNARNKQKFNITYVPNGSVSRVFCFLNVTNQTPNYYVNWVAWEVNGSQNVQVKEWKPVKGWKKTEYGGETWFYLQDIPFLANLTKVGKLSFDVAPNSTGKYDVLIYPSSKGLAESVSDGTYFYLDPWFNASYPVRVKLVVNNPTPSNFIDALLAFNISAFKGYCNVNCSNVQLTLLNASNVEVPWLVMNLSSNASFDPRFYVAPSPLNAEVWAFLTANVSASNASQTVGYLYLNATNVTGFPNVVEFFATNFSNCGGWTLNDGGSCGSKVYNFGGIPNMMNYFPVGQTGGFASVEVYVSSFTGGNGAGGLGISVANNTDWWGYWGDASPTYNRVLRRTAGSYTQLQASALIPSDNSTYGFSYYPSLSQLQAFHTPFVPNESQLYASRIITAAADSGQTGSNIAFTSQSAPGTAKDFCWLYFPSDETQYCRLYDTWGGLTTGVASENFSGNMVLSLFLPLNSSYLNPVDVKYYAKSNVNASFPCNVTLNGLNVFNESHVNNTNTSFSLNTTAQFNLLNVTCEAESVMSATVYFSLGGLTDCSTGTPILNFTFASEEDRTAVNGNMEATFWLWNANRTAYSTGSFSWNNVPNATVCSLANQTVSIDSFQIYWGTNFNQRSYFLWNATIPNGTVQQIMLYQANSTLTKNTQFQLFDANGVLKKGAFIRAMRYYPATNSYATVAMLKTDDAGESISYLTPNDVWFRFVALDNGTLLWQFSPETIPCDPSLTQCTKILRMGTGTIGEYWQIAGKISYSCSQVVNTTTCSWTDTSGLSATFDLKVWKQSVTGSTLVCETNATTSSGLLACDITGNGDGNYNYVFMRVGSFGLFGYGSFIIGTIGTLFGPLGVFIMILIFMVIVGAFSHSISTGVFGGSLSLLAGLAMGLIAVNPTYVFAIAVVGLVIGWKLRH